MGNSGCWLSFALSIQQHIMKMSPDTMKHEAAALSPNRTLNARRNEEQSEQTNCMCSATYFLQVILLVTILSGYGQGSLERIATISFTAGQSTQGNAVDDISILSLWFTQ